MSRLLFVVTWVVVGLLSFTNAYGTKARYPSNRMLDFNWPESNLNTRKFPHEKYCNYYYNRESEDVFTIRKCPTGESFDYHRHECKVKELSKCWSHRYGKHEIHNHIHSKWRKHFKCPFAEGKYPDIFDCSKFIACSDGIPTHKHCTPDKLFDKDERHCVNEVDAICASVTDKEDLKHKCPSPTGNFGHPHDCSKYFECHLNEPKSKSCEKDKLFDEVYRDCMEKEQVFCGYRYDPYRENNSSKIMTKTSASSISSTMDTTKAEVPTVRVKLENPTSTTEGDVIQSSMMSKISAALISSTEDTTKAEVHAKEKLENQISTTGDGVIQSSKILTAER